MVSCRALEHLRKAAEIYEVLEDWIHACECYYILAVVSNAIGDGHASLRASEQWLKYKTLAGTNGDRLMQLLHSCRHSS